MSEPKRPDFLIPAKRGRLLAAIQACDFLHEAADLYCGNCFSQLRYAGVVDHIPNSWSTCATKHHRLVCRRHGNIHISFEAEVNAFWGAPVDYEPSYAEVLDFLMPEGEVTRLVDATDGVHRFTTVKVMSTDEQRDYYRAELRKLQRA